MNQRPQRPERCAPARLSYIPLLMKNCLDYKIVFVKIKNKKIKPEFKFKPEPEQTYSDATLNYTILKYAKQFTKLFYLKHGLLFIRKNDISDQ